MIVNMPANNNNNASSNNNNNNNSASVNNNNSLSAATAAAAAADCEYNFLKRKYDSSNFPQPPHLCLNDYSPVDNAWKKRHLEPLLDYDASAAAAAVNVSSAGDMSFQLQLSANAAATNGSCPNAAAAFINDLFAYDTNLLVFPSSYCGTSTLPTFSAPISVCASSSSSSNHSNNNNNNNNNNASSSQMLSFDADANWQATDLLELDHRYNSALQSDIGQLHATLSNLSAAQPVVATTATTAAATTSSSHNNFLVPQKQPPPSSTAVRVLPNSNGKLRSVASLPEAEPDFEDKNLSWLLNFKFDEFPHLSPDVSQRCGQGLASSGSSSSQLAEPTQLANAAAAAIAVGGTSPTGGSPAAAACQLGSPTCVGGSLQEARSRSPKSGSNKTGRKFEELVMEVVTSELDANDMIVAEHVIVEESSCKAPKKPPFTYTELIEYALEDKGELTVSGIYQWISDRFPYYKSNDDRWKNSVRHNLSINPHFRKGVKAPQGAGHLWAISSGDSAENVLAWEHKKQRLDLFFKMESLNRERMQQHQQQMQLQQQQQQHCSSPHQNCQQQQQQQQQQLQQQQKTQPSQQHQQQQQQHLQHHSEHCLYDEAAVAAAVISQELAQHATPSDANSCHNELSAATTGSSAHAHQRLLPFNDMLSDEELRKTAGQILNGIHREVEVQSVNSIISTYHDVLLDNEDYLNPIQKDVVVTESGLRQQHSGSSSSSNHAATIAGGSLSSHSQYYITEIDPMELGIQMSHQVEPSEEEVLFNDEFNLNYFGYNPGSDIVA